MKINPTAWCWLALLALSPALTAGDKEPTILKHDGWVAALAFSPDGKTLASAGADQVVRLWEVGAWKPKGVLKGHTDCVCAVAFDENGVGLASGSFDRSVRVWRLADRSSVYAVKWDKGPVLSVALTVPEKSPVAVLMMGSTDGTVRGTAVADVEPKGWQELYLHKSWVNCLATNSKIGAASGSSDGTVCLTVYDRDGLKGKKPFLEGGAGEVRCVAFNPDGKRLAAGNRYGTVRIWDIATRKEIKTLTGLMSDVWSIAFSPDGKTLAAVDTDWKKPSKIKFYDTATWQERGSLPMPGEILCLAYSPNGEWLAAGSWDKTVRVFPLAKAP